MFIRAFSSVVFGRKDIASGANWMQQIGEAIESSAAMVCVIDEKYCRSKYCTNEVGLG